MVSKARGRKVASVPAPAAEPSKAAPGPRTQAAIGIASAEWEGRPARVYVEWDTTAEGHAIMASPHSDARGNSRHLMNTLGTASASFMLRNLGSLEGATRGRGDDRGAEAESVNAALALIEAIGPQDEVEGALAVQMASNHALTMEMLCRAKTADNADHLALYGNLAVKLQRTFTAQIEALGRMRGKGQQTVRVEHVTVAPGAQAMFGDVHQHPPGGGGSQGRTEERQYGTATAADIAQERKALPGPDQAQDGVPIAGHAERPLPDPRRTVTRRAPRQSKCAQARMVEPGNDRDTARAAADEGDAS